MNKISLCNEVIAGSELAALDFSDQCRLAADMGYDGIELAPFTVCTQPDELSLSDRKKLLLTASAHDLEITSLHWLLVSPPGLSITTEDRDIWSQTLKIVISTIDLCRDLKGGVLVHGSPLQRTLPIGTQAHAAKQRAIDFWGEAGRYAEQQGLTYCIEPLSRSETSLVNTIEESMEIVNAINSPGLQTMIDTSSAGLTENSSVPELIRQWVPKGNIAHVQLNSTNRGGPGDGDDAFYDILSAFREVNYEGAFAIEPFVYKDGGPATAKRSIDYVRGQLECVSAL